MSKKWKSATVATHEQHGEFWLEYDDHFDNKGNQFFLEKLLTKKSPQWRFEGEDGEWAPGRSLILKRVALEVLHFYLKQKGVAGST